MSEKIGCMNCGNISCKNNKKRESKGCGRWKTPEQRILELEEKVGMAERTRDRLISIGFPTFASCKEYAAKLAELEKENAELKEKLGNYQKGMFDEIEKRDINFTKAIEIIEGLMRFCRCFAQHHTEDIRYKEAEQFLRESK